MVYVYRQHGNMNTLNSTEHACLNTLLNIWDTNSLLLSVSKLEYNVILMGSDLYLIQSVVRRSEKIIFSSYSVCRYCEDTLLVYIDVFYLNYCQNFYSTEGFQKVDIPFMSET